MKKIILFNFTGDTNESARKKLKTINTSEKQEVPKDPELNKPEAEMFQHVSEAKDASQQTLDTATEEQAAVQQKETPNIDEPEDLTESAMELPTEKEPIDKDVLDTDKRVPDKSESGNKEQKVGSEEHPAGKSSYFIKQKRYV